MRRILKKNEAGFSLIEIIMSIVLIGIAVPTFSNYFGGLSNSKEPEYFTEAVFLATRQMQGLRNETMARFPVAGVYPDCATFRAAAIGNPFNIECAAAPFNQYTFSWQVQGAGASTPDVGGGAFGVKLTLTVSRNGGGMAPFQLVNLF